MVGGVSLALNGCTHSVQTNSAHGPDAPGLPAPTPAPAHHATLATTAAPAPPIVPTLTATSTPPKNLPVGLVVCAPMCATTDMGRFGDGCGRWLELMAAGQPEMGQSSLWQGLGRAQQELVRSDLRLALPDARKLARILGVTHAALGRLSGTASHETLTYQVWRIPQGTPVSTPVTVSGSQAQILAGLSGLARTLAARLGVAAPRIPTAFGGSPADMALLGGLPLSPGEVIADADAERLCALAPHEPLATLFYLNCARPGGETERLKTARLLLAQLPENSLAWVTVGWVDAYALQPAGAALARNSGRFPQNSLFALCDVWHSRVAYDRKTELVAAERVTRDAPRSPASWLTLAYTLAHIAEDVRKSRLAGHMSPAEWAYLNRVYPQWLAATERAVALDPDDGTAWQRLAVAATFVDNRRLADAAFWKSARLDPDKAEALSWGLQMFQPKWGGSPATLSKVAALATAQHYDNVQGGLTVASSLTGAGFDAQAKSLTAALVAEYQANVQRSPNDAAARSRLAASLVEQKDVDGAVGQYQAAIALEPDNAGLRYDLGLTYDARPRTRLAADAYREALRLDPAMRDTHVKLGYDLKHLHQFPEAGRELELAVREDPRDPDVWYALGELYAMQSQWKKAIPPLEACVQLSPYFLDAYPVLILALDHAEQYERGIAVAQAAQVYAEAYPDPGAEFLNAVSDNLADMYIKKHKYAEAVTETQAAIGRNDNDPLAHENLGEALIGQGHKAEAQAEWRRVLALDHGEAAQAAQEMLAKYP